MNLINEDIVIFDCNAKTRDEAITMMAEAMDKTGALNDKNQYILDVIARDESGSTAVGFDYATPHAKSAGVKHAALGFMRFSTPIQWDADSEPVKAAFQIAVPIDGADEHLEILAKIFRKLIHDDFRSSLANATSKSEVVEIVEAI